MTRDEHAFRRAVVLGFEFFEYPSGHQCYRSPSPSDPADAAEVQAIRTHFRDHWPSVLGLVAVHLSEQRRQLPRFE